MDESVNRGKWPLSTVVQVHCGRDWHVRSAKVCTNTSTLVRPISKPCFHEHDEQQVSEELDYLFEKNWFKNLWEQLKRDCIVFSAVTACWQFNFLTISLCLQLINEELDLTGRCVVTAPQFCCDFTFFVHCFLFFNCSVYICYSN